MAKNHAVPVADDEREAWRAFYVNAEMVADRMTKDWSRDFPAAAMRMAIVRIEEGVGPAVARPIACQIKSLAVCDPNSSGTSSPRIDFVVNSD